MKRKSAFVSALAVFTVAYAAAADRSSPVAYVCIAAKGGKSITSPGLKAYEKSPDPASVVLELPRKKRRNPVERLALSVIQEGQGSAIEVAYIPVDGDMEEPFLNKSGKNVLGKVYPASYGATFVIPDVGPMKIDGYSLLGSRTEIALPDTSLIVSCSTSTSRR